MVLEFQPCMNVQVDVSSEVDTQPGAHAHIGSISRVFSVQEHRKKKNCPNGHTSAFLHKTIAGKQGVNSILIMHRRFQKNSANPSKLYSDNSSCNFKERRTN